MHAARALGRQDDIGTLEVGKRADFALWNIARPADLSYSFGYNPCRGVVNGGVLRAPAL
ncbi:Imidazolonepropionase [compost metagenome]